MAAQVTRRDVGALILLIALELGLLCLLGVTFRSDGERTAARIDVLTYFWPALGPEPLPPEPVEAAPPPEAPKPVEPVRKLAQKAAPAPAVAIARDVAPAPIAVAPAIAPRRPPEEPPESDAAPVSVADPCGGDLCCVAPGASVTGSADALSPDSGADDSHPDRMVITWPASTRDDVVYRVFTLPGRRFVGSSGQNWFVHMRKPDDPDCYKVQACDRAGTAADGPLTICIKRRRTWG